jgi:hypothetical protein
VTYNSIGQLASSPSLLARCAAAAADQGQTDPTGWADRNKWALASQPGWADAWDYALETQTLDDNPDTGVRPGVINDSMILAAVQAILAEEAGP